MRPVRPSDKAPLMEFISRNWGGHDYIPRVWDEWMKESGARTFVAEVGGRPVGMNRIKFLEDGSAWLEGARIPPAFSGRGLASMLGENSVRLAATRGVTTVRLVSNSRNRSARRQVAKMGFKEVARMSIYNPRRRPRPAAKPDVRFALGPDIAAVVSRVRSSKEFKLGGGVFWDGFRATGFTAKTTRRLVKERRALISGDAVAFFRRGREGGEPFIQVGFACGDSDGMTRLIRHIFGQKHGKRNVLRYLCAPLGSPLAGCAKRAGMTRWSTFILFQHESPNG